MRRLMRESFLQKRVYPLFGFYPWECPLCRKTVLRRQRRERRKRPRLRDFTVIDARLAKSRNQASTGAPTAKSQ